MALIRKGGKSQIRKNFTEYELRSRSWEKGYFDIPPQFELSDITLNGLQIIRDHFDVPMRVTSTQRSGIHNSDIDGAMNSYHLTGNAIDFKFLGFNATKTQKKYHDDIRSQGPLYQKLRDAGVGGFGMYETFNHIDSRIRLSVWDKTSNATSAAVDPEADEGDEEPNVFDWYFWTKVGVIAVIVIILTIFIYKYFTK